MTFDTILALDEAIASINKSLMFAFIPLLKQVSFRSFGVNRREVITEIRLGLRWLGFMSTSGIRGMIFFIRLRGV